MPTKTQYSLNKFTQNCHAEKFIFGKSGPGQIALVIIIVYHEISFDKINACMM
jgi:hypothetical protein